MLCCATDRVTPVGCVESLRHRSSCNPVGMVDCACGVGPSCNPLNNIVSPCKIGRGRRCEAAFERVNMRDLVLELASRSGPGADTALLHCVEYEILPHGRRRG